MNQSNTFVMDKKEPLWIEWLNKEMHEEVLQSVSVENSKKKMEVLQYIFSNHMVV